MPLQTPSRIGRQLLLTLLKISALLAILGWLFVQAHRNAVFEDLWQRPKQWDLLGLAAVACFSAVVITLVRWHLLVRALGMPLGLWESLRIGFLAYLFNLAPLGIVGGDLLKTVMLARRQSGRQADALATVFVDRAIGLYVLFLVASAAIAITRFWELPGTGVDIACRVTIILTIGMTLFMAMPLLPDVVGRRLTALATRLPYVGHPVASFVDAVRAYRRRLPVLAVALLMTVAVHSLFVSGIFLLASGLYRPVHPLGTQFVVVPMSEATAVVPIGVGPFEAVLDLLYGNVPLPDGSHMTPGQGFVVALGYRMISVLIAAVGLGYYLASRREVATMAEEVSVGVPATSRAEAA